MDPPANHRAPHASNSPEDAPQPYVEEEPKYPIDPHTWCSTAPEAITADDKELSSPQQPPLPPRDDHHPKRVFSCLTFRTTVALIFLLALLLIAAIIAAGVAGHLAATASAPTATTTITVTAAPGEPTPTSTDSTNTTTTNNTNNSTSPSPPFHFTLYQHTSFTGSAVNMTAAGNMSLPWTANSYVWDQARSECCALFCRDGRDVGYRCGGEVTYRNEVSGGGVDGVAVECGDNEEGERAPPGGWCGGLR